MKISSREKYVKVSKSKYVDFWNKTLDEHAHLTTNLLAFFNITINLNKHILIFLGIFS